MSDTPKAIAAFFVWRSSLAAQGRQGGNGDANFFSKAHCRKSYEMMDFRPQL